MFVHLFITRQCNRVMGIMQGDNVMKSLCESGPNDSQYNVVQRGVTITMINNVQHYTNNKNRGDSLVMGENNSSSELRNLLTGIYVCHHVQGLLPMRVVHRNGKGKMGGQRNEE